MKDENMLLLNMHYKIKIQSIIFKKMAFKLSAAYDD